MRITRRDLLELSLGTLAAWGIPLGRRDRPPLAYRESAWSLEGALRAALDRPQCVSAVAFPAAGRPGGPAVWAPHRVRFAWVLVPPGHPLHPADPDLGFEVRHRRLAEIRGCTNDRPFAGREAGRLKFDGWIAVTSSERGVLSTSGVWLDFAEILGPVPPRIVDAAGNDLYPRIDFAKLA